MTSSNAMAGGVALIATWLVGSPAIAQPTDPWIGTWKLNVTRSTFNPGPPPAVAAF